MAGVSKTNSFGTFLETIEKRSGPAEQPAAAVPAGEPPPASGMTDVSRRVLLALAKGPASITELREQAGLDPSDTVLSDLTTNAFVEKAPGRGVRYQLTEQGRRVVELLTA
jgi:chromosome segregation and condensation protein ScpB